MTVPRSIPESGSEQWHTWRHGEQRASRAGNVWLVANGRHGADLCPSSVCLQLPIVGYKLRDQRTRRRGCG
jgi:hypothetical protein